MKNLNLEAAHKASFKNRESILQSKVCGCFNCLHIFPSEEVVYWEEGKGEATAVCPYCDIDSVLGDASGFPITEEFLKKMQKRYF